MRKLIIAAVSFLLLSPCATQAMDDKTDESYIPKKSYSPKIQPPISKFKEKGYNGKFMGVDKKRDVAVFQETSHDPLMTRLKNLWFGSWESDTTHK